MPFIPYYSILTLLVAIMTAGHGVFVISRNPIAKINQIYSAFCLEIIIWLIPTCIFTSKLVAPENTIFLSKIVYVGVALMPTTALHFAITYLGNDAPKNSAVHLRLAYAITITFIALLWATNQFIVGYYDYPWGYYPKTGVIHYLHTLFILITATYIINMLWSAMVKVQKEMGKVQKFYEYKFVFLSFLFVALSCSDFLHNWGINFFPVGCIFVAFFVISTTYAIFRHNLLGITIVLQKSLIYSILISAVATLYFSSVYVTTMFLGGLTDTHSVPFILLILSVITFALKPLEQKIQTYIERFFFKKSRLILEKENALLSEEIQKQDRLKSVATLAAGMAHEIKNPLTSIKTFAEFLPKKYDDPDFRKKFSRIVVGEVDRVNNIVKQLLEFSKPSPPDLKPVLIGDILEQTIVLISNDLIHRQIEVLKELDMCAMVEGDGNQLRQVFLNLYLNSIQSMSNNGKLRVSAHVEQGGETRITISDTGCGMTRDQTRHAFDPFFTTKEGGTGLGLAIVHGIITKHGGKIEIQSEVGKGTTVSVFLKSLN